MRHPFDLDDLVEGLAELLDALKLERPTIMGVSFGGLIALKFAIRYPYRLDRLIVQGVGARYERGLIQQIASTVLSRFPLPADSPFVNQFFNLLFGGKQKRDSLFEFVTRQIWQTDQSVMAHRFRLVEDLSLENQLRASRRRRWFSPATATCWFPRAASSCCAMRFAMSNSNACPIVATWRSSPNPT